MEDLWSHYRRFCHLGRQFCVEFVPGAVSTSPSPRRNLTRIPVPPLVNVEQAYDGFTHDPKGRQIEVGG